VNVENITEILNKPNNILAIEYLCAIKKLSANITPIAINRCDNGFYSNKSKNQFLSATSIREKLLNNENIDNFIPDFANISTYFSQSQNEIYEKFIINQIRTKSASELEKYYDFNEGIEYRIKEMSEKYSSLNEIKNAITTPRYRLARINKLMLYPLLDITKAIQQKATKSK
jgi:predicted nucleotidyltransferase